MAWLNFAGSVHLEKLRPAFEEALRDLDGSWTIEITRELVGAWWLLVFHRDDGFERTLLLSPREQTPASLCESIEDTFRRVPARVGSRTHGLPQGVTRERRAIPRR
jgi:hypothetical protein